MIEAIRLTGQSRRGTRSASIWTTSRCATVPRGRATEQCRDRGDDWIALGSVAPGSSALAPRRATWDNREKITQGSWTSPFTNKLLFEAGSRSSPAGSAARSRRRADRFHSGAGAGLGHPIRARRSATSPIAAGHRPDRTSRRTTSGGPRRATSPVAQHEGRLPGGLPGAEELPERRQPVELRLQQPQPDSVHAARCAFWSSNRTRFDAFYVQDQYTRGRLTLQGGLRYEHAWSWFPEGENGVVADNAYGTRFLFPERTA